jgi:hypothetical protein
MVGAGRMTATARADIGADNEPDREAWVRGCVQTCDDARPSDDDLDWEFAVLFAPRASDRHYGRIDQAMGYEFRADSTNNRLAGLSPRLLGIGIGAGHSGCITAAISRVAELLAPQAVICRGCHRQLRRR